MHTYVLGRELRSDRDRDAARQRYATWVGQAQPADAGFWQEHLQGQIFPGDDAFAQWAREQIDERHRSQPEVPRTQRLPAWSWTQWLERAGGDRNRALLLAYRQGSLTMTALARHAGLSVSHISRVIARLEMEDWERDKT